jgi:hypothetical protein
VKDGQPEKAMLLSQQMQYEGMTPDKIHFGSGDLRYLLVAEQLKMAGLFMSSSFKVVANLMSLWE